MDVPVTPGHSDGGLAARRTTNVMTESKPSLRPHLIYANAIFIMTVLNFVIEHPGYFADD